MTDCGEVMSVAVYIIIFSRCENTDENNYLHPLSFSVIVLSRAKVPIVFVFQEKYVFCYKTILAYLDSFNAYANFADCGKVN